jgi:small subunit ribosomal protein S23
MSRRIANQVHKQTSRLLLGRVIRKEPRWFDAVLSHPPLPLPPRAPAPRSDYDLPEYKKEAVREIPTKSGPFNPRPLPVSYLEDELRKQFFEDHPMEAFRPRTLVEDGEVEEEHTVRGKAWTRLRQRGRNPSPEECAVFHSLVLFLYVCPS